MPDRPPSRQLLGHAGTWFQSPVTGAPQPSVRNGMANEADTPFRFDFINGTRTACAL